MNGEREEDGGRTAWSSWSVCSRVYRRPLQTWTDIYRCPCDPGRGATFVPSAVIPVTCRYGVLPGKSSGTKNNWGRADGVPSLHVFEISQEADCSRARCCLWMAAVLSCWARTGVCWSPDQDLEVTAPWRCSTVSLPLLLGCQRQFSYETRH